MTSKIFGSFVAAVVFLSATVSSASADAIIKFDLGNTGPDIIFSGGILSTADDGDAATAGLQNSDINFVGFLSFLPDLLSVASLSIDGVTASDLASVVSGIVTQATTSGTFDIWGTDNSLLLSGTLASGVITGSTSSSTGSFFNTTAASFTSGSLLSYLSPTPVGISLALSGILNDQQLSGLLVGEEGVLSGFQAASDGTIDAVPEPASLALLVSASLAGLGLRRKLA